MLHSARLVFGREPPMLHRGWLLFAVERSLLDPERPMSEPTSPILEAETLMFDPEALMFGAEMGL